MPTHHAGETCESVLHDEHVDQTQPLLVTSLTANEAREALCSVMTDVIIWAGLIMRASYSPPYVQRGPGLNGPSAFLMPSLMIPRI
eukprot:48326-Eustigmatos_ZCMA.PRE.1